MESLRNRPFEVLAFVVIVAFAAALVDYLVLGQLGFRLLPLDEPRLETLFYSLGGTSVVLGWLVFRRRCEVGRGFFRAEVAWHRLLLEMGLPVIAATVAGFLGGLWWFLDLFAHFRAQYVVVLLVFALLLSLLRQRRWAMVAAGGALVNGLVMTPQLVSWPSAEAGGGTPVRLLLANVNVSNRDHDAVLTFIDRTDPDIVLLQEVDQAWVDGLSSLDASYPHSVKAPLPSPFGMSLWSRLPVLSSEVIHFVHPSIPSISAKLDVSGKELLLLGTHPMPPRDASLAELRDRQLGDVAVLARRGGDYVIVMGDLNTTPWGQGFRRLASRSGLTDSGRGRGLQWSWPAGFWPLALPIDHALVSTRVRVVNRFIGPDIGSDHYPLVVDVSLKE